MPDSIAIIGAGVAGLCAGIYAQMNGYSTQIYEMHTQPGGLCTAWKRKGYTIDGCINWLIGSGPGYPLYQLWQEVGIIQKHTFIHHDVYTVYEGSDGRKITLYADPDRLEAHLLDLAPQDAAPIRAFCAGIRAAIAFNPPVNAVTNEMGFSDVLKMIPMLPTLGKVRELMSVPMGDLIEQFSDPLLRRMMTSIWIPEMSAYLLYQTLACLHHKQAGFPAGGSLPVARTLEARYCQLGGQIHYGARVEKILVDQTSGGARAAGVRLADGSEQRAGVVISAGDGRTAIFDLLDGQFTDATVKDYYEQWQTFAPIVLIALGVKRSFADEPHTVKGLILELPEPVEMAGQTRTALNVHLYNADPSLNPPGQTTLTVYLETSYEQWKALSADPAAYAAKKMEAANQVLAALERRWPGLSAQVEMIDVATPLTFERYTHNWRGSYEGWLPTPSAVTAKMKQTLPGLSNFYMAGQWVSPGGGLPSGVITGRGAVAQICKRDGKKFRVQPA
jgi:phytoene dehydrogenase-like protein